MSGMHEAPWWPRLLSAKLAAKYCGRGESFFHATIRPRLSVVRWTDGGDALYDRHEVDLVVDALPREPAKGGAEFTDEVRRVRRSAG